MGRVKHSLGLFLTSALIVVALCFSFWIGTEPMQKWQLRLAETGPRTM